MSVEQNLARLLITIDQIAELTSRKREEIFLIVVSKNASLEELLVAYKNGCLDFGESRLNEALAKMEKAPKEIRWHWIGKLQKNKVSKVVGKFCLIHSVDSIELAEKISKVSEERQLVSSILLQVNTSGEATKGGFTPEFLRGHFLHLLDLKNIEILGLMTMAPLTENEGVIRRCFSETRLLRDDLQFSAKVVLPELSMGMSNDYQIAIQEGATLLRIGSAIFSPIM